MKRIIWIIILLALVNVVSAETVPEEVWSKTFGGTDWDYANSVQQTSDGGYIIAGGTKSYGAALLMFGLKKLIPREISNGIRPSESAWKLGEGVGKTKSILISNQR